MDTSTSSTTSVDEPPQLNVEVTAQVHCSAPATREQVTPQVIVRANITHSTPMHAAQRRIASPEIQLEFDMTPQFNAPVDVEGAVVPARHSVPIAPQRLIVDLPPNYVDLNFDTILPGTLTASWDLEEKDDLFRKMCSFIYQSDSIVKANQQSIWIDFKKTYPNLKIDAAKLKDLYFFEIQDNWLETAAIGSHTKNRCRSIEGFYPERREVLANNDLPVATHLKIYNQISDYVLSDDEAAEGKIRAIKKKEGATFVKQGQPVQLPEEIMTAPFEGLEIHEQGQPVHLPEEIVTAPFEGLEIHEQGQPVHLPEETMTAPFEDLEIHARREFQPQPDMSSIDQPYFEGSVIRAREDLPHQDVSSINVPTAYQSGLGSLAVQPRQNVSSHINIPPQDPRTQDEQTAQDKANAVRYYKIAYYSKFFQCAGPFTVLSEDQINKKIKNALGNHNLPNTTEAQKNIVLDSILPAERAELNRLFVETPVVGRRGLLATTESVRVARDRAKRMASMSSRR